jgi:hypothetical protein
MHKLIDKCLSVLKTHEVHNKFFYRDKKNLEQYPQS